MPKAELDHIARRIADVVRRRATDTEEAFKIEADHIFRDALEAEGIAVQADYDRRTVFGGRQDAVYGQLIMEYERPGTLRRAQGLDHAVQQLQGYIEAAASERTPVGQAPDSVLRRLIGVASDAARSKCQALGSEREFLRRRPGRPAQSTLWTTVRSTTCKVNGGIPDGCGGCTLRVTANC